MAGYVARTKRQTGPIRRPPPWAPSVGGIVHRGFGHPRNPFSSAPNLTGPWLTWNLPECYRRGSPVNAAPTTNYGLARDRRFRKAAQRANPSRSEPMLLDT